MRDAFLCAEFSLAEQREGAASAAKEFACLDSFMGGVFLYAESCLAKQKEGAATAAEEADRLNEQLGALNATHAEVVAGNKLLEQHVEVRARRVSPSTTDNVPDSVSSGMSDSVLVSLLLWLAPRTC